MYKHFGTRLSISSFSNILIVKEKKSFIISATRACLHRAANENLLRNVVDGQIVRVDDVGLYGGQDNGSSSKSTSTDSDNQATVFWEPLLGEK